MDLEGEDVECARALQNSLVSTYLAQQIVKNNSQDLIAVCEAISAWDEKNVAPVSQVALAMQDVQMIANGLLHLLGKPCVEGEKALVELLNATAVVIRQVWKLPAIHCIQVFSEIWSGLSI